MEQVVKSYLYVAFETMPHAFTDIYRICRDRDLEWTDGATGMRISDATFSGPDATVKAAAEEVASHLKVTVGYPKDGRQVCVYTYREVHYIFTPSVRGAA